MFKPLLNQKSQNIVMNKGYWGKVEEVLLQKGKEYKERLGQKKTSTATLTNKSSPAKQMVSEPDEVNAE